MRADQALALVEPAGWNRRSCGAGAKGPRYYDWAWIATDHPRHQLLIRRSISDPSELAYYYAYAPEHYVCSLTDLVKVAGTRWTVEDDFQDSKSHRRTRPHPGQRGYRAWKRHVTFAMAAHAFLAVLAAIEQGRAPRPGPARAPRPGPAGRLRHDRADRPRGPALFHLLPRSPTTCRRTPPAPGSHST